MEKQTIKINVIFLFLFFILGFASSQILKIIPSNVIISNQSIRVLDGVRFGNASYEYVENYTKSNDKLGDWICVNVNGMSFERAYEVCAHETGHEIFAEYCEKNIDKCLDMAK